MRPFTKWSLNVSVFFTVAPLSRPILSLMNENSRVDMHVHSTASELSSARAVSYTHLTLPTIYSV